jgi:dolichol kinase
MQALKSELIRKAIHFSGIGYIPLYLFAGKEITLAIVVSLTLFASIAELLKFRYGFIPRWILRKHEVEGVGSHLYTGVSISLVTYFLPAEACFVAIASGIVGDGVAGIHRYFDQKIAGISMFISSFIFLMLLSHYIELNFYGIILSCLAGTFAERFSGIKGYYINDNFSVPVVSSVVYELVRKSNF